MKRCSKCSVEKPAGDFNRASRHADGLRSDCRECQRAIRKMYQDRHRDRLNAANRSHYEANREWYATRWSAYYAENGEAIRQKRGAYYAEHIDVMRKRARDWNRRLRADHPDRVRAAGRRFYQRHRAEIIKRAVEWQRRHRRENPSLHNAKSRARRVRKRADLVVALLALYKGRCHICGHRLTESEATLDHLIPVAAGGTNDRSNLAPAHLVCNQRRGAGRIAGQLRLHP